VTSTGQSARTKGQRARHYVLPVYCQDVEQHSNVFANCIPYSKETHNYLCNRPWKPIRCEASRTPHFLDNRLTDGSKVASVTRWRRFILQKDFLVLVSGNNNNRHFLIDVFLLFVKFSDHVVHYPEYVIKFVMYFGGAMKFKS
jgi:hypothetical protein